MTCFLSKEGETELQVFDTVWATVGDGDLRWTGLSGY